MTIAHRWLETREPAPPLALVERMRGALDAVSYPDRRPAPEVAIDAALVLLGELQRDADLSRAGAVSLLAADALMTYAFEIAASEPELLEALASATMQRISAVAGETAS